MTAKLKNSVRFAQEEDLQRIFEIYNWYVTNTTTTLETRIFSEEEQREWFSQFDQSMSLFVLELENKELVGWGGLKKWSDRPGYAKTVENSIYIDSRYLGRGFGAVVMEALLSRAAALSYKTVLSRIGEESTKSIEFHKKFGFWEVGVMKSVGFKMGRELDVVLLQKML